jgi:hypothetical protein
MRPDIDTALQRVSAVRARVADLGDRVSVQEIEDELCDGYAQALEGDAWLTHADDQLHAIILDIASPVRGRRLRVLAAEHGEFQRSVIALRRELAALRREHDRLRANARAA